MHGALARHRACSKMRAVIRLLLELGVAVFTGLGHFWVRCVRLRHLTSGMCKRNKDTNTDER